MGKIKTVLISTASLPHTGVASWTTEMNYLLQLDNELDYIIGPYSEITINEPKQIFIDSISFLDKIKSKRDYINRFNPYIRGLKKVLELEEQIVLQVKDNFGLLKAVLSYIKKNNLRKRVYVQYHYHSFLPFSENETLLSQIDELTLLTDYTYSVFRNKVNSLPLRVTINTDGIDSSKFKPVNQDTKNKLRNKFNISKDKLVFVWCSQDRKKKGLDLTILIWQELLKIYNDEIKLLVFGTNKKVDVKGVTVKGLVPNDDLIEFYQLSDFYLFPTLWQEGFGLSLAEALKCGSYCISANNGATSVVLNDGKYGKLVENPHLLEEWLRVIQNSIEEYKLANRVNPFLKNIPENLFDMHEWYLRYNEQIREAKKAFEHRYYI